MPSEIGIEIWKDSILVSAKNAEPDCRCLSNISYYDGCYIQWPFSTWGIDIIGKIHPIASNGHEFILMAINYFTKWVEVALYKVLNAKKVAQFIQTNIIC